MLVGLWRRRHASFSRTGSASFLALASAGTRPAMSPMAAISSLAVALSLGGFVVPSDSSIIIPSGGGGVPSGGGGIPSGSVIVLSANTEISEVIIDTAGGGGPSTPFSRYEVYSTLHYLKSSIKD